MSKHIAYEYGVLMIVAAMPQRALDVKLTEEDWQELDTEKMFRKALEKVRTMNMYRRFLDEGWTTELAVETKTELLPEIVRAITLGWYSAAAEAYGLSGSSKTSRTTKVTKPQKAKDDKK